MRIEVGANYYQQLDECPIEGSGECPITIQEFNYCLYDLSCNLTRFGFGCWEN